MISIIVPVYNVAPYLPKCLESLLIHQGADIEVLAIDDGSTDDSGKILEDYARRYPNVRVFTQSNQGVAVARNVGLDNIRGDYVMFVDPDDWLEPMAVSRLLELMNEQPCDIIGFNYFAVNDRDGTREDFQRIKQTQYFDLSDERQYTALFEEHGLKTVAWDCIFRSDIVKELRFERYPNGEDTLFSFMALLRVNAVLFTSETFYNYLRRAGTASMRPSIRKEVSILKVIGLCSKEIDMNIRVEAARHILLKRLKNWLYPGRIIGLSEFYGQERKMFIDEWIKAAHTVFVLYFSMNSKRVSRIVQYIFSNMASAPIVNYYYSRAITRQLISRCWFHVKSRITCR